MICFLPMMQLSLFGAADERNAEKELAQAQGKFEGALLAKQTRIGYEFDWSLFKTWCQEWRREPFPATVETVLLYLTDQLQSGHKVSTVRRRYHALAHYHRLHSQTRSPWGIKPLNLLRGAQRLRCEKPRKMRPITITDLCAMSKALATNATVLAVRDRAILLLGFLSALRSASLVSLTLDDIEFVKEGLVLTIPREKQDQEGRGRYVGIPFAKSPAVCAVRALQDWLPIRPTAQPTRVVFVSVGPHNYAGELKTEAIERLVRRSAAQIGLDRKLYGAHSLRSGFICAVGEAGVSDLLIADHTGHRDMDCLRGYFRKQRLFHRNPCTALEL